MGDVTPTRAERVPSFMKPTFSVNRKSCNVRTGTSSDVDAAKLMCRDSGPGFNTSSRPSPAIPNGLRRGMGTSPSREHGIHSGHARSRLADADTQEPLPDSWDRVRVFVRVRPALWEGETPGSLSLDPHDEQKVALHRQDGLVAESRFRFDTVLNGKATQQDVYAQSVQPIVEDVLMGYNGTVMAYGQTGAGKTFTLSQMDPKAIGMMPRAMADIFSRAAVDNTNTYRVYMSYVQIYMEVIKDLLLVSTEQLAIREDTHGIFLDKVHEVQVHNTQDCLKLLQQGEANRVFASTDMNAHSSRSHAIVIVTVYKQRKRSQARIQDDGQEVVGRQTTMGRMFMVDLAGSERLKKSRSVGVRATEAKHINQSLTTLGMCVYARADPDSTHIPFRDSKLTRLLQESLGGNAKTSMIIAVSDVKEHSDETMQSLLFGSRAILVKTEARVNQFIDSSAMNDEIASQLENIPAETALERALLDKDHTIERIDKELHAIQYEAQQVKKRYEKSLQEIHSQMSLAQHERDASQAGIHVITANHHTQMDMLRDEKYQAAQHASQEASALQETIAQLKDQNTQKDTTIAQLRGELARKDADIAHLNTKVNAAECTISDLVSESDLSKKRQVEMGGRHSELEGRQSELEGRNAALHSETQACTVTIAQLTEQIRLNAAAHAAAMKALEEQHSVQLGAVHADLEEVSDRAIRMEAAFTTATADLAASREQITSLEATCESTQAACDATQATCDDMQAKCEAIQATCDTAQATNESLQAELDTTKDLAAEARCENSAYEKRIEELEGEVCEEQHRSNDLSALLSTSLDDLACLRQEAQVAAEVLRKTTDAHALEVMTLKEDVQATKLRNQRAMLRRGDVQHELRAVMTIQRCWRAFKVQRMKEDGQVAASRWGVERIELSAAKRKSLALNGRALIVQSTKEIESSIQAVLLQMLLPNKSLAQLKKAKLIAGIRTAGGSSLTSTNAPRTPEVSAMSNIPSLKHRSISMSSPPTPFSSSPKPAFEQKPTPVARILKLAKLPGTGKSHKL